LANMDIGLWRPVTEEGKQSILNSIYQCMDPSSNDPKTGIVSLEQIYVIPSSHVHYVMKAEDKPPLPEDLDDEDDLEKIKKWHILDGNHRREVFLALELQTYACTVFSSINAEGQ